MKPGLLAFLAIILWASVPTVTGVINSYNTNFYTATLGMFLFSMFGFGYKVFNNRNDYMNKLKSINRNDKIVIFLAGVFIAMFYLSYYYALSIAPRVEVTLINFLWPIFSIVFATLIFKTKRESFKVIDFIRVFMSIFGLFILVNNNLFNFSGMFQSFHPGYIFALVAAISAATYINLILIISNKFDSVFYSYFSLLLCAIPTVFLFGIIFGIPIDFNADSIGLIIFLGIAVFFGGQSAWMTALKNTDKISRISILAYATPVISTVFLLIFLGESVTLSTLLGGSIIILSNFLSIFNGDGTRKLLKSNNIDA